MPESHILVAADTTMAQIRVIGRADFSCSQGIRDFGVQAIDNGVERLIIDLSECASMDSTFMGHLAVLGLCGKKQNATVEIANGAEAHVKQLGELGLRPLFVFSQSDSSVVDWVSLSAAKPVPSQHTEAVLEAHETLMSVDPDNVPRFKDVVEFLRNDLANGRNGSSTK